MYSVERLNPALDAIVDQRATVELIAEGFSTGEGPVWMEDRQCLVFSDLGLEPHASGFHEVNGGRRLSWSSAHGLRLEKVDTGMGNGMAVDPQGRLVICESRSRQVTRIEHDGSVSVLADEYRGARFNAPSDIAIKSDGSIYFTGGQPRPGGGIPYSAVFRIAPDASSVDMVAHDFQSCNGITFSPDETVLYVNDAQGIWADSDTFRSQGTIRAYSLRPNGWLVNSRLFAELRSDLSGMPDGMTVDQIGNVYSTGPGGVWVFDSSGTHLGTILTGVVHNLSNTTSVAFGGEDYQTLFITTISSLLSVRLNVPGVRRPSK